MGLDKFKGFGFDDKFCGPKWRRMGRTSDTPGPTGRHGPLAPGRLRNSSCYWGFIRVILGLY